MHIIARLTLSIRVGLSSKLSPDQPVSMLDLQLQNKARSRWQLRFSARIGREGMRFSGRGSGSVEQYINDGTEVSHRGGITSSKCTSRKLSECSNSGGMNSARSYKERMEREPNCGCIL